MAGHQDQGEPTPADPGRLSPAERARLDALHQLAPLAGRRLLVFHAWLLTAAADAELVTVAQAHEARPASSATRPSAWRSAPRGPWSTRSGSLPVTAAPTSPWPTCWPWPRPS
jgi:hypothetical protein